jgi:hypothetical protein
MVDGSGVCVGTLRHRRFTPVRHEFTYPLFMALLDIDRIDELMAVSRVTSRNRFNWATFADRDHLGDPSRSLRERVAADAAGSGLVLPPGRVLLLTHLRYLGYCFNPVSFFYCHDACGRLQLVLAEVNNTCGGRHRYWVRPHDRAAKAMYVSPFIEPDVEYSFDFSAASASLVAHMEVIRKGAALFDATLRLERREWNAREIQRALLRHPAMTAAVIGGIHWEALKLWWKGVPVVPRLTADGTTTDRTATDYAERPL